MENIFFNHRGDSAGSLGPLVLNGEVRGAIFILLQEEVGKWDTMGKKFFRRVFPLERLIMLAFIFGLSMRKVGQVLLPILEEKISPPTVSRVEQQLYSAVLAYHQRRLLIFGRFFSEKQVHACNLPLAQKAAQRFGEYWGTEY